MNRKMKWGLAILIILLGTATVLIIQHERAEIRELQRQLAESNKLRETGINESHTRHDIIQQNYENKPNDGNEYVWHGDHWHRVVEPEPPKAIDPDVLALTTSDLPDELPADFPTDEELRQMSIGDIRHLINLYTKESLELQKTDYDAGLKLHNTTLPILWEIRNENSAKLVEARIAGQKYVPEVPRYRPATEELPAMILEVEEYPNDGGE